MIHFIDIVLHGHWALVEAVHVHDSNLYYFYTIKIILIIFHSLICFLMSIISAVFFLQIQYIIQYVHVHGCNPPGITYTHPGSHL